ncbi:MAG: HAD family phosphatase [Chloroflexi bacterium]|nr:HAD family phosphatase [Chloroflexota bacterium]
MIAALIFDVGGVLIRTEDRSRRAELEKSLGLSPGQTDEIVFNSRMGQAAQMGEITSAALWAWVQTELGLDTPGLAYFRTEFWAGDRLNSDLLALIRRLHPHYQTAIISNFMDDLRRSIGEEYPLIDTFELIDAFDLVVISAEEKVMKPSPVIFQRTLERLGRLPEESVFVDDFAHNVAGARAVGMHAIHYTPETEMKRELAKLGVVTASMD